MKFFKDEKPYIFICVALFFMLVLSILVQCDDNSEQVFEVTYSDEEFIYLTDVEDLLFAGADEDVLNIDFS